MRKHPSTCRLGERLRVRALHRPPRAARPRRRLLAVVVPLDLLEQHPVLGAAATVSVAHAVVAGARVVRHDGGHAAAAPLLLDRELLADEVVAGLRLAHLNVVLLLLVLLVGRELDVALLLRAALQPPLGPVRRLSRVGRGPLAAADVVLLVLLHRGLQKGVRVGVRLDGSSWRKRGGVSGGGARGGGGRRCEGRRRAEGGGACGEGTGVRA